MTGYGKSSLSNEMYDIDVEIKTLNSKYFDLRYYSAKEFGYLEPVITKLLKQQILRGNIEFKISIRDKRDPELVINEGKLRAIWKAGEKANKLLNTNLEMALDRILLYQGIIEMRPQKDKQEKLFELLEAVVNEAIEEQQIMAVSEGSSMKDFFLSSLDLMEGALAKIKELVPIHKEQTFNKIEKNIKELLNVELTDDILRRIVIEAAFYVDRSDVNEEVLRLEDHVLKCKNLLNEDKNSSGKTFNFVIQEMHREANTLGSKFSNQTTFEHILVIKEEIDKCKEMILNVQ